MVVCAKLALQTASRAFKAQMLAFSAHQTQHQRLAVIILLVASAHKVSQVPMEVLVALAVLVNTKLLRVMQSVISVQLEHTRIQVDMVCVFLVRQVLVHPRAATHRQHAGAFQVILVESLLASLVISASIRVQMEPVLIVPQVYAQSGNIGRHVRSKPGLRMLFAGIALHVQTWFSRATVDFLTTANGNAQQDLCKIVERMFARGAAQVNSTRSCVTWNLPPGALLVSLALQALNAMDQRCLSVERHTTGPQWTLQSSRIPQHLW